MIRHRYFPLVIAQLINLANSARKQISVFLDLYSTRELIASERLHFLLTQQYISLPWKHERLAVGVLSLCTELLQCDTRRSIGSQFLYSIYLCDSLCPLYTHPYASHAQPISFFLILSPARYWVRSTKHLSPSYAISSSPPLPRPS